MCLGKLLIAVAVGLFPYVYVDFFVFKVEQNRILSVHRDLN